MDLSWISTLPPWLLTYQTALLLVGGFVVGIFSVIARKRSLVAQCRHVEPSLWALLDRYAHLRTPPLERA